ncbi:MAG: peptidase [Myxococcales bacterium]|nr:peptidase [Myxococcales bacterium]
MPAKRKTEPGARRRGKRADRADRADRRGRVDWLWVAGFLARLGVAGVVLGGVLVLLLRHRDVRALVHYSEPPEELTMPVQGVPPSAVKSTWGDPRSGQRTHEGIDIFARRGTPVLTAAPGEIIRVGRDRLGGNVVWVSGSGGCLYYYAHLDRFASGLRVGQAVTSGFTLGQVGTSGNARGTPPHLHFGIYPGSNAFRAVDPAPLLQARAHVVPLPSLVVVASQSFVGD